MGQPLSPLKGGGNLCHHSVGVPKGDATSNEIQSVLSTWPLSEWFLSTWILSQLLLSSWLSAFVGARMRAWHTHHVPEQLTCNWLSLRAGHTHTMCLSN